MASRSARRPTLACQAKAKKLWGFRGLGVQGFISFGVWGFRGSEVGVWGFRGFRGFRLRVLGESESA